ncbi:cytochrome c oxidase subunit II [Tanticharoenia sakaeratensis]|uniref:Cytochrome c oxidase, subunit II n=1 Tax=Tanticharoenia sakaeratensis NBRC 103193 TaxID=1231623 RepID=A0A0D6MIR8_9PROT|nr:hypothetical protein [Tanticharoenia sakaeratensis]GAN53522.1 cytochrome c oxidase, subunit II [Tanticharoenia sakaeratensis NBRC 103193]GBQ17662.1 cytochrome o ubiquinol oxidase subunit II [Tanticharoenia sakaeratensis NBRC 103193]
MRRACGRRIASGLGATLASVFLSGCGTPGSSFMSPGGIVAASQRHWLIEILLILTVVAAPIFIGLPLCIWRYRRHAGGAYRPNWGLSRPLEYVIWGVPCLIVLLLSLLVIGPENRFSPYDPLPGPPPLRVQVVALNWKWLFIYPDQHVASVDKLAIPAGRPVRFFLTSDSTMQSFFIPALGSQIYAMAGMVTQLNLQAINPGHFDGKNTQFNGMGFQDDRFDVEALSENDFQAWINRLKTQPRLDTATYAVIARQGSAQEAAHTLAQASSLTGMPSFSEAPPDLFKSVVDRYSPSMATK